MACVGRASRPPQRDGRYGNSAQFRSGGCESVLNFGRGIAVQHENLAEMGAGRAKQIEAVCFRLGEGLFMAEDNVRRVVLDPAKGDESMPLQLLAAVGWGKPLRVAV